MNKNNRMEEGFSLIELTLALSITIVLTGLGIVSFSGVNSYTKNGMLELATHTVFNDALSNIADFDEDTQAIDAKTKYDEAHSDRGIEITIVETENCLTVIGNSNGQSASYDHGQGC